MHIVRTVGVLGAAATLLLSAGVAFAEEGSTGTAAKVNATLERSATAPVRNETEQNVRERAKAFVVATSTALERIRAVNTERESREKAEREKVEQRLGDLQDKKRQQLARKLATQFVNINKIWTERFAAQLDRLTAIVQKIEQRAAVVAASGKDITAVTAAVQVAKNVIATAQADVAAQAAKTYVPDPSTMTTTSATSTPQGQEELAKKLKTSFQSLHAALFKDLFTLRDGPMTAARRAVQDALQTLGKVPGVDEENATSTASRQ